MSQFSKVILRPGTFVVNDEKGNRRVQTITPERIKHWVESHQKMRDAGLMIPAPVIHDMKFHPSEKITTSKDNIGFWEKLAVDAKGNLVGVLDVPLPEDAKKIGKTIKATSVFAVPKFVDGKGTEWNDVLTHITVTNEPIEQGQTNFKEGLALAMAQKVMIEGEDTSADDPEMDSFNQDGRDVDNSSDVFELLSNVAGVYVDPTTQPDQLPDALKAALLQKQLSEKNNGNGSLTIPPKGASQRNEVPIVMSQQQTPPVAPPVAPPVQPAAPSNADLATVMSQNANLLQAFNGQKQQELTARVGALRQRGLLDDPQVEAFKTKISGVSVKFDEGKPVLSEPEIEIRALESVRIALPANPPIIAMAAQDANGNFVIQPQTVPSGSVDVTDARAQELADMMLGKSAQ